MANFNEVLEAFAALRGDIRTYIEREDGIIADLKAKLAAAGDPDPNYTTFLEDIQAARTDLAGVPNDAEAPVEGVNADIPAESGSTEGGAVPFEDTSVSESGVSESESDDAEADAVVEDSGSQIREEAASDVSEDVAVEDAPSDTGDVTFDEGSVDTVDEADSGDEFAAETSSESSDSGDGEVKDF